MSIKAQLLELEKQKAAVLSLEAKISAERQASLATLPSQFGYSDLASFVKAVRAAAKGTRRMKPRAKRQQAPKPVAPIGQGMAKSLPKPAEPVTPTGTNLDDPANFGVLPDAALLSADLKRDPQAKARLAEALSFAGRILHTSKIPAAIWREWRQFEKQANELLRVANSAGPTGA